MYRQIPVSSKIINKKIKERDSMIHELKLKQISSQVDSKRPDHFNPLLYTQNKKKVQLMEDKFTEIERENRILLEKITKIMHPPKSTKSQNQDSIVLNSVSRNNNYSTIQQPTTNKKKSLNQLNRRKELVGIMEENKRILERIKTRKSEYNHRKWEDDYKKNEQLLSKISEFPVNLYKKNASKANFTRNDFQYNPQNSHMDQSSASIKRQNYSLDRSIGMTHQRSANSHKRDRSFHLEPLNTNNSRVEENKNVLYRQSKQFGLNYYIIEISISNGIVADDIENPLTRVLEMFENDGLRVLNKFFNNNLEDLVSNLKITDKIYIKGLEKYQQTDPGEYYQPQNEKLPTDKSQVLTNNKSSPFIYDKATDSQQENGYTTNDSFQNRDQFTLSSSKENAINGQYSSQRKQSINKAQNYLPTSQYYSQTPNRKALREITEQNSTNNNTLESRVGQQANDRATNNNTPVNSAFTNSKLAMDFFNSNQQQQQQQQSIQEKKQTQNNRSSHEQNNQSNDNQQYLQMQYGDDGQEEEEEEEEFEL